MPTRVYLVIILEWQWGRYNDNQLSILTYKFIKKKEYDFSILLLLLWVGEREQLLVLRNDLPDFVICNIQ